MCRNVFPFKFWNKMTENFFHWLWGGNFCVRLIAAYIPNAHWLKWWWLTYKDAKPGYICLFHHDSFILLFFLRCRLRTSFIKCCKIFIHADRPSKFLQKKKNINFKCSMIFVGKTLILLLTYICLTCFM